VAVNVSAMMAFVLFTARMLGQVFSTWPHRSHQRVHAGLGCREVHELALICILYLILDASRFHLHAGADDPFVAPITRSWDSIYLVRRPVRVLARLVCHCPPFGLNLFVLKGVVPSTRSRTSSRARFHSDPYLLLIG